MWHNTPLKSLTPPPPPRGASYDINYAPNFLQMVKSGLSATKHTFATTKHLDSRPTKIISYIVYLSGFCHMNSHEMLGMLTRNHPHPLNTKITFTIPRKQTWQKSFRREIPDRGSRPYNAPDSPWLCQASPSYRLRSTMIRSTADVQAMLQITKVTTETIIISMTKGTHQEPS